MEDASIKDLIDEIVYDYEYSEDPEDQVFILKLQGGMNIHLKISGDCCSRSYYQYRDRDLFWIKGLKIKEFTKNDEIIMGRENFENEDLIDQNDKNFFNEYSYKIYIYQIHFYDNDKILELSHLNISNGYYSGYLYICKSFEKLLIKAASK